MPHKGFVLQPYKGRTVIHSTIIETICHTFPPHSSNQLHSSAPKLILFHITIQFLLHVSADFTTAGEIYSVFTREMTNEQHGDDGEPHFSLR